MQKLLLQPNWDVVPQQNGVRIYSIQEESSLILLIGKKLSSVFSDLIAGITESELLRKYPTKDTPRLLNRLKKIGAVKAEETACKSIEETNYLDLLVNHTIGPDKIVRQIIQCPIHADNPFFNKFHVSYGAGFAPRLITHQSSLSGGWGADTDGLLADIKAAVEAVERYALAEYDETSLRKATWKQVKDGALTATQLGTSEAILENTPNILWGKLERIKTAGSVLAPLDFLHHPVDYGTLSRYPITPLNISGVAAHQSVDAAITNGLLELCEHEALVVTWYGQRETPSINPKSLDQDSQEHIKRLEKMGWKVILKDISLDLTPVVMAVALGPIGKRALTIGSCAAFSMQYAAKKALTEAVRTILVDEATNPIFPLLAREEVNDVLTHGLYYARHENIAEAEILWTTSEQIDATDLLTDGSNRILREVQEVWEKERNLVGNEKEYVTDLIESKSIKTYYSEITPKQIQNSHIPLFVVRTLAPEMVRMTVGHNRVPAQTSRFKELLIKYTDNEQVNSRLKLHPFS